MISLIYGAKGSGKTKRIIDAANDSVKTNKGSLVYISDRGEHARQVNFEIRFIDSSEYGINCSSCALGFIKGILSYDNDITNIFIDGFARMCGTKIEQMEEVFKELDKLSLSDSMDFTITVSTDNLPPFLMKYV